VLILIDISQPVTPRTAVFPGDTQFSLRRVASMDEGFSCDVGTITTTLHIGTHADAPNHFVRGAASIADVALAKYFGPCRVVERISDEAITAEDVASWGVQRGMRYLVRTRRVADATVFPDAFAHLAPEAARVLAAAGIELFGIDTSSVDHRDSKTLDAHKALLGGGVAILENLNLADAPVGYYELMAFPLRIEGADASPVRAVLRTLM
jgi:arylformamidase